MLKKYNNMKRIKNNAFDLIFWLIISLSLSAVLFIYSLQTNIGMIMLALGPIAIYLIYFIGTVAAKGERFKLNSTNKHEDIITDFLSFIIFVSSLFLISNVYIYFKITLYVIMILVGIYGMITLRKKYKHL